MYLPGTTLTVSQTRFNQLVTAGIEEYDSANIRGKSILKVDLIEHLDDIFGRELIETRRRHVWYVISGVATDAMTHRLYEEFYNKSPTFANFCDVHFYFGDKSKTYFQRLMSGINAELDKARLTVARYGGRYLGESKGFIYYGFDAGCKPTAVKGQVL